MKKVCVIDGQGGGIGSTVIKRIKERFEESVEVIALGTNAIATAQMLKARANKGASGTNAIVQTVKGAEAVSCSRAKKVLLPLTQENIAIVGMLGSPLPQLVDELLDTHFPLS